MNSIEDFRPKESQGQRFLAEGDVDVRDFFTKSLKLLTTPYTYNVSDNPFIWFGALLALPVPFYLAAYELNSASLFLVSPTFLIISLGHLLVMSVLFGALGSLYWDHYANLRHRATHDQLTNLLTHSTFLEFGKRRVKEARRYDRVLSLVMLDLDYFKRVNDTLGHKTGDEILVEVANILKTETRKTDVVGRYGGEEFSILLPETPLKDSYEVAERIRMIIDEDDDRLPDYLTISGGVGSYPSTGRTLEGIVETVDKCLYYAKEEGRNRIKTVMELPDTQRSNRRRISLSEMSLDARFD